MVKSRGKEIKMKLPFPEVPFDVICFFPHGEVEKHTVAEIIGKDNSFNFYFDKEVESTYPRHYQASWIDSRMCCLPGEEESFMKEPA
jgi:hypothetical protein